jgi:hypothetical protein
MARKSKAARGSCNYARAKSSPVKSDVSIVQQRIEEEWKKGCFWAAFAFVLLFGFMILGVILWNW